MESKSLEVAFPPNLGRASPVPIRQPPGTICTSLVAGGALFLTGLMEPIANGSFVATMQASVPRDMQGRVFALLGSATQAVVPFGLALAGPLCDRFGMRIWFLIGGISYLIVAFGSLLSKSIMNLEAEGDRLRDSGDPPMPASESAVGE